MTLWWARTKAPYNSPNEGLPERAMSAATRSQPPLQMTELRIVLAGHAHGIAARQVEAALRVAEGDSGVGTSARESGGHERAPVLPQEVLYYFEAEVPAHRRKLSPLEPRNKGAGWRQCRPKINAQVADSAAFTPPKDIPQRIAGGIVQFA